MSPQTLSNNERLGSASFSKRDQQGHGVVSDAGIVLHSRLDTPRAQQEVADFHKVCRRQV